MDRLGFHAPPTDQAAVEKNLVVLLTGINQERNNMPIIKDADYEQLLWAIEQDINKLADWNPKEFSTTVQRIASHCERRLDEVSKDIMEEQAIKDYTQEEIYNGNLEQEMKLI